jgi:hypothetical protein
MATLPSELDQSIFDSSRFPHHSGVAGSSSSPMFVLHKNILKPSTATDDGHTGSATNVAEYPYNIAKGDFTENAAGNLTSIVRVKVSPEYHSLQFWLSEIEQNSLLRTSQDDLAISIYGKHPIRAQDQIHSPNVQVDSTFEQVDHVWLPLRFPNPSAKGKTTNGLDTGQTDGSGAMEMYAFNFLYAGSWYPNATTVQTQEGDGIRLKGGTFSTDTDIGMSFKCPQTVLLDGCSEVMMTVHTVMSYGNAPDAAFMMGRFLA